MLADIKRQRQPIEELYILGDVIAATSESTNVIQRIRSPHANETVSQVCQGRWEEQLLILHGLGRTGEPTELIERYEIEMVKTLWDTIPQEMVEWVRLAQSATAKQPLDFGFFELDCLLIHGSSVGVSDELTPNTPAIQMLDRLMRMDANILFCGHSGLTFQYEIQQGSVTSSITTLDQATLPKATFVKPRQVIGAGNVGRIPGRATYTLYSLNTNQIEFKTVRYGSGGGFQANQQDGKSFKALN